MICTLEGNNKIQKNLISQETESPARKVAPGETMFIFYKLSTKEEPIDSVWPPDPPYEIKVGSEEFLPFFNLCIESMNVGEKSKFEFFSEEYNEDQILEIWLVDSKVQPKRRWDYSPAERLELATEKKQQGDSLLRSKDRKVGESGQRVEVTRIRASRRVSRCTSLRRN